MQVYLIASDSHELLEEKLADIIHSNDNVVRYNYLESSLIDILEEASYVSMFQDMKYLVVRNADFFSKAKINEKETEYLLNYLESPYPCTTIIFTTYETVDKRKNITKKIIDNYQYIELVSPKNYDLFLDTKKKLQKYQIGEQSIKYLIEASLGNYDLVTNEIGKLSLLYHKDDVITLEAIKNIVASNTNENVFRFTDAVIRKDAYEAIHLFEEFLLLKMDPLQLINLLIREYRLLYYYKIFEKKRVFGKELAQSMKLQDWQVNKIMKSAVNYHIDDLSDYLLKLSEMDYKIKSGQHDKTLALYSFLIQVFEY